MIQLAREFHDAARLEAVGRRDDQQARVFDAGRLEHARRGSVAHEGRNSLRLRVVQHQVVALDDREGQSLFLEHRTDGAADAPVAHDDRVIAQQAAALLTGVRWRSAPRRSSSSSSRAALRASATAARCRRT